ncbi:MAG: NitT/TauT family transport system substrate-binding protein [Acidobacteriota bacterium]|jgi:NitT/TauT family transport system substrate-binding protein|nr:NitT/TauT family transport system substrate-binding protein [Acidobacteriota bacterium]
MFRSRKALLMVTAVVLAFSLIAYLRYRSLNKSLSHDQETYHQGPDGGQRQTLTVAFVPVTCHLTCPVTDYASKTSTTGTRFDALRFTEFPTIVEALKAKRLVAAFLTVPLAMKLREQGVPIKIACLGHRDGSQLVIRKENPAKDLRDLRGKTIAIPNPFSNENFFMNKMMRDQGLRPDEIKFVSMAPPDMTAALATNSIDGFIVAEPFCAKAEMEGYGRVLYYAKDIWPNYISCALVVHEDLIRDNPAVVRDLVRGINESGEWTEQHREDAAKLVAPYFRQDEKLLRYVLTQPPDRVTYRNLNPTDEEMNKILDMGISLGFLTVRTPMTELMDKSFFPEQIQPARIDISRMPEVISGQ